MKTNSALGVVCAAALVAGCAALTVPQNAEEFKSTAGEKYADKFEVKRSYRSVSDTLKKKSAECLDVSVTRSYVEYNGPYRANKTKTVKYRPAVSATASKTEMQLQEDDGTVGGMQSVPQGGMYIVVVDVSPAGSASTRVEIYGANFGFWGAIPAAIKGWVNGENLSGCPQLP